MKRKKKTQTSKKRHLVAHYQPKSTITEQYRTIRSNIVFSSVDKQLKTIMVTSSGPGEGKSTTVANLGIVMAQQGKHVLIIDADMRKPTAHYTFALENRKGLTTILTKEHSLEESIQSTDIENLSVLTSGPIPPNPAELLSSVAMETFMKYALTLFDIVIFDTPPVLAVTDAQILANKCDGTVLVVRSDFTGIDVINKAKELLIKAQANIVGSVLNGKKMSKESYHYGSYYAEN